MRLLHTSDWHLGRSLVSASLLEAQATFLEWLLDVAVEHDVDAVLVAGDVYDRSVPPPEAVSLLGRTFASFAAAGIPLVVTSGNHDSAVRLGFGAELTALAGVHLRTSVDAITEPVVLRDQHGEVGIYGVPYLLPDAVREELGAERSHTSVLAAASALVRADAAARGLTRTVVLAHAFVTGGALSESERDLRVGGIADADARALDGHSYVALGHLHRPQQVRLAGSSTTLRYSGSPMAFSFSERTDTKSVTLVELDAGGLRATSEIATPVPRTLREVRGRLDDLLADPALDELAECWVKVVLTDASRPAAPMERLRERWPHTLVLDFDPEGAAVGRAADLERLARTSDPVQVAAYFVEYVDGAPADDIERLVLRDAVEMAEARRAASA